MRIAVDVGGTFTDVIVLDEHRLRLEKVETTPHTPTDGVLRGFAKAQAALEAIDYFVHGTTLGLNALLTRSGARVAVITTRGFRDIYELGRTARDVMYDLTYHKPASLVPRSLVFEVLERLDFQGNVLTPFDYEAAAAVAQRLREQAVEAVAVCFLHSYANPAHELAMAEVLAQHCPGIPVTLSHQLSREYREYERTSTTVIDAAIKPLVRGYLERLDHSLKAQGFGGHFLLTRSGGGAMTVSAAQHQPVHLVLSGPAGGVIGASALSELIGQPNLISLDMGGTSLDASLIVNSRTRVNTEAEFEGPAISLPILDIKTIGAGGGSIGWIDEGGHLQVGPHSAGALPGPACYAKGGQAPTFTDAALLVGYLDPNNFLGGAIPLDADQARQAVQSELAEPFGPAVSQVAAGIVRISEAKISGAIREISIEQGFHPKDFGLLAFGGGGGLVASSVARELGIPMAIIPPGPANFSAWACSWLTSSTTFPKLCHGAGRGRCGKRQPLVRRPRPARPGRPAGRRFEPQERRVVRSAELRYQGQEHTVNLPLPEHDLSAADLSALADAFNRAHAEQYGHRMDDPVELVTLRLRAVGLLPRPSLPTVAAHSGPLEAAHKAAGPSISPPSAARSTIGCTTACDWAPGPSWLARPLSKSRPQPAWSTPAIACGSGSTESCAYAR